MLSILIPCYNYKITDLVFSLVKMLEEETITYEIIVVDDGSNNQEFLSENKTITKLPNCSHSNNEVNLGRTKTRDELAKKSHFENLLFLDADVLPLYPNFIKNYISLLSEDYNVVCGGCSYENTKPANEFILRWEYGKSREENKATLRNQKPFSFIFSGNILIKKELFLACNFSENKNLYGLDIFFSYNLFIKNANILHIDNEILHLGLEVNALFLKKSLESVESRFKYLSKKPKIEEVNSLLKHYKTLKKLGLNKLFGKTFIYFKQSLEKNILGINPNLFLFDLYRLGYLCTLKQY